MKKTKARAIHLPLLALALAFGLTAAPSVSARTSSSGEETSAQAARDSSRYEERLKEEVRHQFVMLPWYSVFDNLAYRIECITVILEGQVQRPSLKPDAESAVKRIKASKRWSITSKCCHLHRMMTESVGRPTGQTTAPQPCSDMHCRPCPRSISS